MSICCAALYTNRYTRSMKFLVSTLALALSLFAALAQALPEDRDLPMRITADKAERDDIRADLIAKGITGILATVAVLLMSDPGDDDERRRRNKERQSYDPDSMFRVVGSGDLTAEQARQLTDEERQRLTSR